MTSFSCQKGLWVYLDSIGFVYKCFEINRRRKKGRLIFDASKLRKAVK